MTIKGKHARVISRMTRAQMEQFDSGGWVDESFNREAVVRVLEDIASGTGCDAGETPAVDLPGDSLCDFLGFQIGVYRVSTDAEPAPAEVQKFLDDTLATIDEVRTRLHHLPASLRRGVDTILARQRGLYSDLREPADESLAAIWSVLAGVGQMIEAGKKASPAIRARRWLEYHLDRWVRSHADQELSAARTAVIVGHILMAAGIEVPEDPATIEKDIREISQAADKAG